MAVPILPASVVADDKTAMMLQPLLEQEAQLEAFITEAKTQRKLEDAMTLQTSLEELRQEIARIASG
jgi:rabenosyn-5